MTLRQIIQAAPSRTNELIAKLANTSNEAVKTRERLFSELEGELSQYLRLEQQQLVPVLRKHPETKQLADQAAEDNQQLRARLRELAATPKNEDVFLERVNELKKGLQQYLRNERNELLPSVLKALTDEEAGKLTENMERAISEAEQAKRDEKRREAEEVKRQAEEKERAAAAAKAAERSARKAAEEVQQANRRITEDAADMTRRGTETMQNTLQSSVEIATKLAERSLSQVAAAVGFPTRETQDAAQQSARNLQAIFDSGAVWADTIQKLQQELLDIARDRQQQDMERYGRLFRSRSLTEFAAVQLELARGQVESIVEGSKRSSRLLGKAADTALQRMQSEQQPRSRAA